MMVQTFPIKLFKFNFKIFKVKFEKFNLKKLGQTTYCFTSPMGQTAWLYQTILRFVHPSPEHSR